MNANTQPELLAPAGSPETFYAALEAGADAVYLGVNEFNARLRASNFTLKTLSYLIPYAHKLNKKIYITLNTVIKQQELERALTFLLQLEELGVDAVIMQDLGLAHIASRYCSKLPLHASTQMVAHNSDCVTTLTEAGFKRIILARELSLKEIETIQKKAPHTELEVFIHGALCYSVSGLCLASSFLGGLSGNRGRCTQVCRRAYSTGKEEGFYFSPKDFCALDFIEDYRRIGISCLKIEGRMKGAEYVHTVVSAYRKALDSTESLDSIKETLKYDFGREKTSFFLNTGKPGELINGHRPSGTGYLIGTVREKTKGGFKTETKEKLKAGDRLRIHGLDGLEGTAIKISKLSSSRGVYTIETDKVSAVNPGDYVYLTGRGSHQSKKKQKNDQDISPVPFRKSFPLCKRIIKKFSPYKNKKTTLKDTLYLRANSIEWLHHMNPETCDGLIFNCDQDTLQTLLKNQRVLNKWLPKAIISLPPFIQEADLSMWKKGVSRLRKAGISRWMCGHIGQRELIPPDSALHADSPIWCANRATQQFLQQQGFDRFSYSCEDDILNLKASGDKKGFATLFAYVPLFISRIKPPLSGADFLVDRKDFGFFIAEFNRLYYTLGERPLCLTHRRSKLREAGISNFVLDLSFFPAKRKTLKTVLDHYHKKAKIPGTTLFNHKGGFK